MSSLDGLSGSAKPKRNESKDDKREFPAYKYSNKGKGPLHEAAIIDGRPLFLKYDDDEIKLIEKIEEANRIIRPPYSEEYPYEPYDFADIEEIQSFVNQAKSTSINSLYLRAKEIMEEYNDQDYNKLVLIATDILFSYFQDKYATTHYVSIVGDNDSGKSSLGITFEAIGYRPVYMTDPSAANIFRCLGSIESGQCAIILDEADKIDKSPEMMAILKTGYQFNGKVPKINTNTLRQEFFFTYGLKVIISERSMSLTEAKGVYDRTFSFTAYAGDPKFDIKETLNPQANAACQGRLDRLRSFRKLMLIYRLVHFKDPVQDMETGLKRRNRELCKPVLQLFYDCRQEIQIEIKSMLEHFLAIKKHVTLDDKYGILFAALIKKFNPVTTPSVGIPRRNLDFLEGLIREYTRSESFTCYSEERSRLSDVMVWKSKDPLMRLRMARDECLITWNELQARPVLGFALKIGKGLACNLIDDIPIIGGVLREIIATFDSDDYQHMLYVVPDKLP